MLSLLLAASMMGPPAPPEPDLLHHFDPQDRGGRGGAVALHIGLQAAAAAADLWSTRRCLQAGTCVEAHPLSDPRSVPYIRKAVFFSAIATATTWALMRDRDFLAWTLTALSVGFQTWLTLRALSYEGGP